VSDKNTKRQLGDRTRNPHDVIVIFDDSPMAASAAVAALRDLGMSDNQIARYFGTSPLDIKQRVPADETARGA
jgi:hypothetical protein